MGEIKHSRELINKPDESEIPQILEERAQSWISESGATPEFSEFLDSVNFPLIRDLYLGIATRCGIPKEAFNFVDKSRILAGGFLGAGQYDSELNLIIVQDYYNPDFETFHIALSPKDERQMLRDQVLGAINKKAGSINMGLLHTIIHEEGHAVSRNVVIAKRGDGGEEERKGRILIDPVGKQSGVRSEYSWDYDKFPMDVAGFIENNKKVRKYSGFSALNEGITEKLSREVLLEYFKKETLTKEDQVAADTLVKSVEVNDLSYSFEVSMVDAIVGMLAKKNGVSERVAWESFVHAYFNGESFTDPEVVQLFEDTFGPDFLGDLSRLSQDMFTGQKEEKDTFAAKYGLNGKVVMSS